ncbi:MAG: hypothetical protein A3G34_01680 [Candidatus Lindowbacteria bacterium RIFCSPLOWO2_12_FULL_62_27]|nr:MAG: hypothetical protein A3I06_05625 [Candidatus Lindowbacteria bacterium RIFCSPLOWO2_02_FULL_62_12]OGH59021.1 MAG: hypothetical protein A3G34_01680 [Candidatus Lindowbacteria bacterium RIFCSPLOWO2_12_FULL_62_27]
MDVRYGDFVWDANKEKANIKKHGVDFRTAALAFMDQNGKIIEDMEHSRDEERFYCIGMAHADVLTVWFTYREALFRIIGAGYFRKGRSIYEKTI